MENRRGLAGVFLILLAGIVLASLLALFASSEVTGGNVFVGFIPRELLQEKQVGLVGASIGEGFRHIYFGRVSLKSGAGGTLSSENGSAEVARGLVTSQEHEIAFLYNSKPVQVSFVVDETNGLGLLIARANGRIVWSGNPGVGEKVEFTIPLESLRQDGNSLVFSTTSSGWKIWSPSYYRINRISVGYSGEETSTQKRQFALTKEEIDSFVLGRVIFTVSSASPGAPISIKINNATIWKSPVGEGTLPVSIDFSSSGTTLSGENEIAFLTEKGNSAELAGAEIIVFTSSEGKGTPATTFSLTREDFDVLNGGRMTGRVEFTVSEVSHAGTIQVSIVGDKEVTIYSDRAVAGTVLATFTKGSAVFGKNLLVFSSPDEGIFRISDLSVKLERT
ncbi:MAG: hypothetical protein V1820_01255 [archaeon]